VLVTKKDIGGGGPFCCCASATDELSMDRANAAKRGCLFISILLDGAYHKDHSLRSRLGQKSAARPEVMINSLIESSHN
jgi:hypothetical protein